MESKKLTADQVTNKTTHFKELMNNSKNVLITGATSGIGTAIAIHLAQSGYSIIVCGRSGENLNLLKNRLQTINSTISVYTVLCDLSSYESIKAACTQILTSHNSIDVLILNAGLWNFRFIETADKIEETFQVNLLSQMIMYNELKGLMPKNEESKVIFTSSGLHQGTINFSDIEFRDRFSGFKAYRQSKLGLIMLTRWLANQTEHKGISFYCVHPGMVNTNLGRSAGWFSRVVFKLFGKSIEKGAQTHIHLIDQKNEALTSGAYYANSRVTQTTPYSYKMTEAHRLWHVLKNYTDRL